MIGICVDYRTGYDPDFTPLQAICDVKSAVRWVRENAGHLGVDANKIVVCGSSAGGYIAVSSIMFEELHDLSDQMEINPNPNALVIFGAGMDGVDIMSRRYPELLDRAVSMSPLHNVKKCLPPTLWMIGTEDDLYDQNKSFVNRMVEVGNDILFETYDGMEHGFFLYGRHGNRPYRETNQTIEEYLRVKNFLS